LSKKDSEANDRVAIKVYKDQDHEKPVIAGHATMRFYLVEVQSLVLVMFLKEILEPLGTFLKGHETAEFRTPFKPLYFAQDKIVALHKQQKGDTILKIHLQLLLRLMTEMFGSLMTHLQNLRESKLVCYDLAWTNFPKGTIVYSDADDCERLYRVISTKYYYHCISVKCQDIIFTGFKFE
jgi:hypothetical protein